MIWHYIYACTPYSTGRRAQGAPSEWMDDEGGNPDIDEGEREGRRILSKRTWHYRPNVGFGGE